MAVSEALRASRADGRSTVISQYGGRKVFADPYAIRGDIHGMMTANKEYNTYLTGLARLTGAGADMIDKFWGIMLETQARDTETALSKAYRDTFTEMATDEKYHGKDALNLSSDFMVKKKEIYDRFLKDNPDANKRILNNIDAQLQNRYYDRIGALQTDRIAQWHTQSKIDNMAEMVDSAALSQLGDFNALQDVYNKSKELFGNDPVRGRTLANEGLKTVLQAWAGQNPAGFMAWSKGNKDKVLSMFGGSNAKDIDAVFTHAQARVRSDIAFANSQAAHARQMALFQRQEDSYKALHYVQKQLLEHPEQSVSLNQPVPELGNRTIADVADYGKLAGIFAFAKQWGATGGVAELEGRRGKEAEVFGYLNDTSIPLPEKQKQIQEWIKDGTMDRAKADSAYEHAAKVANLSDKTKANREKADIFKRAEQGDEKASDDYLVLLAAGQGSMEEYKNVKKAMENATQTIPILGKDNYNMYLDYAKSLIAPQRDMMGGIIGGAQRAMYEEFRQQYTKLGQDLMKATGGNVQKVREQMVLNGSVQTEATKLLEGVLSQRASYARDFNAVNPQGGGDWMNTGRTGRGARGRTQASPQVNSIVLPRLGGAAPQKNPVSANHSLPGVAEPPIGR